MLLSAACTKKENKASAPFADFDYEILFSNDTVARYQFNNLSVNAFSYRWTFDDNLASEQPNPVHEFYDTKMYKVILTAYNEDLEEDTAMAFINVNFDILPPVAMFGFTEVYADSLKVSVQFNNLSYHAVDCYWDFGDTTNSTEKNPLHDYFYDGTYDVELIIWNALQETDTLIRQLTIEIP